MSIQAQMAVCHAPPAFVEISERCPSVLIHENRGFQEASGILTEAGQCGVFKNKRSKLGHSPTQAVLILNNETAPYPMANLASKPVVAVRGDSLFMRYLHKAQRHASMRQLKLATSLNPLTAWAGEGHIYHWGRPGWPARGRGAAGFNLGTEWGGVC